MDLNLLIEKHGTSNPFQIINNLGIGISFKPYPKTFGYYFSVEDVQHIVINSKLDTETQRIVAAHELGHAILHKDINVICSPYDSNTEESNKLENEADLFSLMLLLSDSPKIATNLFNFFPRRGSFIFLFLN